MVRGLRADGTSLRMSREYIQQGIRSAAEHLCTRQFGYRTELDAADAERREISEARFTSLDRRIMQEASNPNADFGPEYFAVVLNPTEPAGAKRRAFALNMRLPASPFFTEWAWPNRPAEQAG